MKTVTGRVISAEPISLSKAATLLSGFASSENGATQAVSAYLRRASTAFTELKRIHREIKSSSLELTKSKSDIKLEQNPTGEFDEVSQAKGIVDLVENGGKIGLRESETVTEEQSINEKKKKKKSKKKKDEEVVDEKVKEKLEDEEQRNEERKEEKKKKKKKSKKEKEENVVSEEVNEKLEDEQQRNEERKEKKKKRKSDGEIGSEERKSKKKRKSKEIDD